MHTPTLELSVIIPAFNEEAEIHTSIRTVDQKLASLRIPFEIIVIDDGSNDQTAHLSKTLANDHIHIVSYSPNKGKGYAVKEGVSHSKGKYVLFMDVDLSTDLGSIDIFLARIRQGHEDMLIGDRKSNPNNQIVKQPWHRRVLGNVFIWLSCLCVGQKINDFTCGFKLFTRPAAEIIFQRQLIHNWAFDTELIYIALLHHLRIGQVPVLWRHHRNSNVRPLKDVFTSLSGLVRIKLNYLKGLYR